MHFLAPIVTLALAGAVAAMPSAITGPPAYIALEDAIPGVGLDDGSEKLEKRAVQKANEYKSGDCSGSINYGHHSPFLAQVTMDDSSHSVYINGGTYRVDAYDQKTSNGGRCYGRNLGTFHLGCHNLDHPAGLAKGRVKCVVFY